MTLRYLLLIVSLLVFLSACGSSGEGETLTRLSSEEKANLAAAVEPARVMSGYDLALPAYLPREITPVPYAEYRPEGEVMIQFQAPPENREATTRPIVLSLLILQGLDPARTSCPPCPDGGEPDYHEARAGDTVVQVSETRSGPTYLATSFAFRKDNYRMILDMIWEFGDITPLTQTEKMEEAGLRIVESMIAGEK